MSNPRSFKKTPNSKEQRTSRRNQTLSISHRGREDLQRKKRRNAVVEHYDPVEGNDVEKILQMETVCVQEFVAFFETKEVRTAMSQEILDQAFEKALLEKLVSIRLMLSKENNPPIRYAFESGAIDIVYAMLEQAPRFSREICRVILWIFTNVFSEESHEMILTMLEKYTRVEELIYAFLDLDAWGEPIVEQTLWCLSNIILDDFEIGEYYITKTDIVHRIIVGIMRPDLSTDLYKMIAFASWSLMYHFSDRMPNEGHNLALEPLVPLATTLLSQYGHLHTDIVQDAFRCLDRVVKTQKNQVLEHYMQYINLDLIIQHIGTYDIGSSQHTPISILSAMQCIGGICSHDDPLYTDIVLDRGFLTAANHICTMIIGQRPMPSELQRRLFWTISNITAGTEKQAMAVFDPSLNIKYSIVYAAQASRYEVKQEALYCLTGFISKSNAQETVAFCEREEFISIVCEGIRVFKNSGNILAEVLRVVALFIVHSKQTKSILRNDGLDTILQEIHDFPKQHQSIVNACGKILDLLEYVDPAEMEYDAGEDAMSFTRSTQAATVEPFSF